MLGVATKIFFFSLKDHLKDEDSLKKFKNFTEYDFFTFEKLFHTFIKGKIIIYQVISNISDHLFFLFQGITFF